MNKTILGIAIVAAAIGIVLLLQYKEHFEARVSGGPKVAVLVAAQDVPMGTKLTKAHIGVRDLPLAYVEPRHIRASETLRILGIRARSRLSANDTILWSDLSTTTGDSRTLAGLIRPGMRAV